MNKKESVICEFEMALEKSFCCWFKTFNIGNDDVISVLFKHACNVAFCDHLKV